MHALRTDDTAVSEVVGVVLMVAITVLLASTAAVFFLEFGNESGPTTPPTAAFETDYSSGPSDVVTFSHQSGDNLEASELTLVIEDANVSAANGRHDVQPIVTQPELSAGSSIKVSNSSLAPGSNVDLSGATITLVWEAPGSTKTTTLAEWSGPDA
ncbi:type IV pilin N-terminal domain-containing protein [Halapricum hydrolyticum]|uniref:Type IV pilin N-terminal domain-containing protein n=1 Tax=Halapricum hydrolyticum TaxID=2979991 RepID=A0AAE3ICM9_9EURY|nr:type IV pilin N-terminal domain-containing protein [Halapricum hydrolyticum]MCU4718997.1 type IV pilin N-terminal domain-containing protein [Halapricum hydrolyticum]MCU4727926.1 type IV pilin N-terminal domain-containing protein [Halapricum hydrolyticum]